MGDAVESLLQGRQDLRVLHHLVRERLCSEVKNKGGTLSDVPTQSTRELGPPAHNDSVVLTYCNF